MELAKLRLPTLLAFCHYLRISQLLSFRFALSHRAERTRIYGEILTQERANVERIDDDSSVIVRRTTIKLGSSSRSFRSDRASWKSLNALRVIPKDG